MQKATVAMTKTVFVVLSLCLFPNTSDAAETVAAVEGFHFIDTSFENASPLDWEFDIQACFNQTACL